MSDELWKKKPLEADHREYRISEQAQRAARRESICALEPFRVELIKKVSHTNMCRENTARAYVGLSQLRDPGRFGA